jgi:hypothetical protein
MKHDPDTRCQPPCALSLRQQLCAAAATFFARQTPSHAAEPWLIKLNEPLAEELGLDVEALKRDGAAIFSGNLVPDGADPLAMAYAGHQFGSFVPQLGDGRAILLGEVIDTHGKRRDIQLKGAGRDALFAAWRRAGGARAGAAGIYRQRGHACARRAGDAGAGGGIDRPASLSRAGVAGCGVYPCGGEPYPGRHVPVLRGARRYRWAQGAGRLCDRAALSRAQGRCQSLPRAVRGRLRAAGGTDRQMAACRLHSWGDEHRQHDGVRRDHRFRALRLHGRV